MMTTLCRYIDYSSIAGTMINQLGNTSIIFEAGHLVHEETNSLLLLLCLRDIFSHALVGPNLVLSKENPIYSNTSIFAHCAFNS